ncbi:MAG: hypothetical protein KC501_22100 [Myxococcales bacterium]|nr:hypothetical protein [Myxococcales bacterium]
MVRPRALGPCLLLLLACDRETDETIAKLQERVASLDQALDEGTKTCETNTSAASERVGRLETQVASLEADKVALSQKAMELEEEVAGLQAKLESLSLELATKGGGALPEEGARTIGVPECDSYLSYFSECIDEKLPEAARESSREALDSTIDAWKEAAGTPEGREALATACKTARDTMKEICG